MPSRPASIDGRSVSAGLQATIGVYVAVVCTGGVSLAGAVLAVPIETVLSIVPTVCVGGLLGGAVVAWARPGLVQPVGRWRWRTIGLVLPGLALGAVTGVVLLTDSVTDARLLVPAAIGAAGTIGFGICLSQMAHDLYIEAAVAGDPDVQFPWRLSGPDYGLIGAGFGAVLLAMVLIPVADLGRVYRLQLVLFVLGVALVGLGWSTSDLSRPTTLDSSTSTGSSFGDSEQSGSSHYRGSIRVFDDGLVIDPYMKPSYSRLIAWGRITNVRLADDELVLKRRWRPPIRCARDPIEDPETVVEAIEQRVGDDRRSCRRP